MTLVYYKKVIKGKLYPRAAREGKNVAYVNDIYRSDGRVVSEYVGIRAVPKGMAIEERRE